MRITKTSIQAPTIHTLIFSCEVLPLSSSSLSFAVETNDYSLSFLACEDNDWQVIVEVFQIFNHSIQDFENIPVTGDIIHSCQLRINEELSKITTCERCEDQVWIHDMYDEDCCNSCHDKAPVHFLESNINDY